MKPEMLIERNMIETWKFSLKSKMDELLVLHHWLFFESSNFQDGRKFYNHHTSFGMVEEIKKKWGTITYIFDRAQYKSGP